jgi:hypothetical protein
MKNKRNIVKGGQSLRQTVFMYIFQVILVEQVFPFFTFRDIVDNYNIALPGVIQRAQYTTADKSGSAGE